MNTHNNEASAHYRNTLWDVNLCLLLSDIYTILYLYVPQFNLTPLMLAAYNGHCMLVELLLAKEADPSLIDDVSHFSLGIVLE